MESSGFLAVNLFFFFRKKEKEKGKEDVENEKFARELWAERNYLSRKE